MVEWIHLRLEDWMSRYIEELDFWDVPRYITFYRVVRRVDAEALMRVLQEWLEDAFGEEAGPLALWHVDSKVLRGRGATTGPPDGVPVKPNENVTEARHSRRLFNGVERFPWGGRRRERHPIPGLGLP